MFRIGRIKVRNFKSFRFIDIPLSSNFIAVAGPNGSGKSNGVDAIRFALGEMSLRSLRAKRVKDLIFAGSEAGEVTLYFEGDETCELQRAIRKDGKIRYRLNGKTVKRYTLTDFLKQYNLDDSGRNIIAQGEVQRIVQMNGKERRGILDSVAGIADFEEKKKEALRELEIVNTRIKDANLVMGERLAFLEELRVEREQALAYQQAKGQSEKARASLLHTELEQHRKKLEDLLEQEEKLRFNLKNKQTELAELEANLVALEQQRTAVSAELQKRQKTAGLIQKIEELRASVGSKKQSIQDHHELRAKLAQEWQILEKEIGQQKKEIQQLDKELGQLVHDVQTAERQSLPDEAADSSLQSLQQQLQALQNERQGLRERTITLESENASKQEILGIKQKEAASLEQEMASLGEAPDTESVLKQKRQVVRHLEKEMDDSFSRTKELNVRLAELDKELLECKEKASILRLRATPALMNPALQYLTQLKEKESGIYGTLAELIEFEPKYAEAVEAAAGGRLLYVVVEDAELATRLIAKLKTHTEGRVTFIPLKEIKVGARPSVADPMPLTHYLRFSNEVRAAVDFVFGTTLLVDDMTAAKKLGVGRNRMVTLSGELFEPSGIITGGKVKTSVLVAKQLRALEEKIEGLQTEKKSGMDELLRIRELESGLRARKAQAEIEIKTTQFQAQRMEEELQKRRQLEERRTSLLTEIQELTMLRVQREKEMEKLRSELEGRERKLAEFRSRMEDAQVRAGEQQEEQQRKREEHAARLSFLKASLDGKQNELQLRKQNVFNHQQRSTQMQQEQKGLEEKVRSTEKELTLHAAELAEAEEQFAHQGRQMEKLFSQLQALEGELQVLGGKMGKKKLESERLNKDTNELDVKKATVQTRLEDITHEYAPYQNTEKLALPKEELSRLLETAEKDLSALGNVNLAAIEMYQKKKEELGELEEKLKTLSVEREAVLKMMDEIETHKRDVFFETFQAVADNFRKMFRHLAIGEGILYLDKPNEPFESGLHIKLRRGNKDHPLDSLSGGENSLIALMFIFAMQFFKPSPFYILDEVDAALDKENSKNLARLISSMSKETQFLIITHNDIAMANADAVLGVTKMDGISKVVGVRLAVA